MEWTITVEAVVLFLDKHWHQETYTLRGVPEDVRNSFLHDQQDWGFRHMLKEEISKKMLSPAPIEYVFVLSTLSVNVES